MTEKSDANSHNRSASLSYGDDLYKYQMEEFDFMKITGAQEHRQRLNSETLFEGLPSATGAKKKRKAEDSDGMSNRMKKCLREKQRRAELNNAFGQLSKTLGLSGRTEKTVLLKTADQTIENLRAQVDKLQHQLTLAAVYPNQKHLIAKENSIREPQGFGFPPLSSPIRKDSYSKFQLPEIPTFSASCKIDSLPPILPKVEEESSSENALKEMKQLVSKVENLYKLQVEKAKRAKHNPCSPDTEIDESAAAFPQCA
eukprot:maker-scaffold_1-snap-gene-29.43-mRNA-1 protein AED:0.19 eAED:0.19 QI:113/1/1/1/1/1/2/696/255